MNKKTQREIAKKRIEILFEQAKKSKDHILSKRYISLANKIAQKVNLTLTKDQKRKFCKHCHSYFVPNKNVRVRLKNKKVVYYCLSCKKFTKFPYIKEKLSKKVK